MFRAYFIRAIIYNIIDAIVTLCGYRADINIIFHHAVHNLFDKFHSVTYVYQ